MSGSEIVRKYKCEECGKTFKQGWSDEEAKQEAKDTFGIKDCYDMAVVCDDCYKQIMKARHN